MERLSPAIPTDPAQRRHRDLTTLNPDILGQYTKTMKRDLGSLALYLANLKCKDPFQPKCPEAWDLYRPLIEDLWFRQNLPLRELAVRMRDDHNFKASEKQFRDHTTKWNMRKYQKAPKFEDAGQTRNRKSPPIKQQPRDEPSRGGSTSPTRKFRFISEAHHRRAVRQLLRLHPRTLPLHQTAFERLVECGLVGMRDYVYSHSERHDEWNRTNKFDVIISEGPFFLSFDLACAALGFYYQGDIETFGVFIRESFDRVSINLRSVNPGLMVEALLHVPFLLLTHGPPDVLCHYIYNLACYAHMLLKHHPIYHTIMAIASSLYRPGAAEHLANWIGIAARLWEDIYRTIRGELDRNAINAYSERLYMTSPPSSPSPFASFSSASSSSASSSGADEQSVRQLVDRCRRLHAEAAEALGPTHRLTLQLERKVLAVQSASSVYLSDFPERGHALVERLESLRLPNHDGVKIKTESPDGWGGIEEEDQSDDSGGGGGGGGDGSHYRDQGWTAEHWTGYRRVQRWTGCYWYAQNDLVRAVAHLEKCLYGPFGDEPTLVWVLKVLDELELCYIALELDQKRDEIRRRRLEVCEAIKRRLPICVK